ncbi:hypothetical protein [Micromonospora sp. KC207]|uniref:hypothetical protein n=1 Tax=Micromonospora sp. KC207 TaxID=2530377 RepID=UPI00352FA433
MWHARDEPWEGLDAAARDLVPALIDEVLAAGGSVLVSDHRGETARLPGAALDGRRRHRHRGLGTVAVALVFSWLVGGVTSQGGAGRPVGGRRRGPRRLGAPARHAGRGGARRAGQPGRDGHRRARA